MISLYLSNCNDGFVGGIIVAWKADSIQMSLCANEDQYIHLPLDQNHGKEWLFHNHICFAWICYRT